MGNKINIAELLKDCPSGMELDCTSYDNVSFDKISDDKKATYPIFCYTTDKEGNRSGISFTEDGCESKRYGAKCVIFPKGKTTWEGFRKPFKDGDILTDISGDIYICKIISTYNYCGSYASINSNGVFISYYTSFIEDSSRYATESEKEKLFQTIKDNGYKWNAETKTLERLIETKFKVGDRIRNKTNTRQGNVVTEIKDTHYILDDESALPFIFQDQYEIVPNKFDITILKPFESKVLVRDTVTEIWIPSFWGFYDKENSYPYRVIGGRYRCCIPYKSNEYLLGTTEDCDEYYKNW